MLELARHWSEAMVPDAAAKTAGYAGQAGELSLARLAPEQARTWFERGLAHLDRSRTDDPELRCALSVGLGDALQQLGDPAARDTLLDAAHRAGELGQVALLARAALATSRGFSSVGGADPRVIEVLRLALERVSAEEHGTRALLLAVLSTEQLYDEPMAVRRRAIDEAIAEARASGDDGVLVRVLNLVYPGMWCPSTIDERMALSAEAVALAVELGDEVEEFWARLYLVSGTSERGTWLTDEADRYHDIAARIGQPMMRWVDSWAVFNEASLRADPAAAEAAAEAGLAIGMESGQADASAIYGSQVVLLSAMRGRRAELVPLLAPVADQMERTPIFWAWLAMSLLESGDRGQAHEVLDDQLPLLPAEPDGLSWLATCVAWAEAAARLSDVPAAEVLIARLEPHRRPDRVQRDHPPGFRRGGDRPAPVPDGRPRGGARRLRHGRCAARTAAGPVLPGPIVGVPSRSADLARRPGRPGCGRPAAAPGRPGRGGARSRRRDPGGRPGARAARPLSRIRLLG